MWGHPWTKEDIASRPWIDNVGSDDRVDALSGCWDKERHVMMASWQIKPVVRNLEEGMYGVCVAGALVEKKNVKRGGAEIAVELKAGGTEVVVVLKGRILS
jgi:hypothetical protein